jgi:MFS family permease
LFFILGLVTSNEHVNPEIRGSVAGCYSLFGGLGLLITTKVGGLLFDVWSQTSPFLIMSLCAGVSFLGTTVVIVKEALISPQNN